MKTDTFDITKLIEDLTESEKMCLRAFLIALKGDRNPEKNKSSNTLLYTKNH